MDRKRFLSLCESHNVTIAELERTLNMSNGSLRKNSDLKSDRLLALSKYFGVSMDYLMGEDSSLSGIPVYNPRIQDFIDILPKLTDEQITSLLHTAQLFASMNGGQ